MAQKNEKITQYHTHITSKHNWYDLNLKEVWQYRDLIWLFTERNFVVKYKQTILGPMWIFLNPLISSLIYAFVFGGIAGIGTDGVPSILFYLAGNAIWNYFASCVTQNAGTFTANAGMFGKVYFPRLTMPISNVLSSVLQFGVQMILVLGFLVYYVFTGAVAPNWGAWLLIPVVLLHLGLLGLGCGIIISSLTTQYRDLAILVTFGVSLWMYATPIVYTTATLPETWRNIIMLNPMSPIVETFRYIFTGAGGVPVEYLLLSVITTVVVLTLGIILFSKVEKTFMDTV